MKLDILENLNKFYVIIYQKSFAFQKVLQFMKKET